MALMNYCFNFPYELCAKVAHNMVTSVLHPGTVAICITLTPSATFGYLGNIATDQTKKLAWQVIAATTGIGIQGTGVGMTNQQTWEWLLEWATLGRWSSDNASKARDAIQTYINQLAVLIKDKLRSMVSTSEGGTTWLVNV